MWYVFKRVRSGKSSERQNIESTGKLKVHLDTIAVSVSMNSG